MKTVDEDIKTGNFKQIYLFYGEEGYLKKQYRDKLKNALSASEGGMSMGAMGGGGDMNFTAFEGKDTNPKEVIDLAETLPFFADRRVILIENSGFLRTLVMIWRTISQRLRRRPIFCLWRKRSTSVPECIKRLRRMAR